MNTEHDTTTDPAKPLVELLEPGATVMVGTDIVGKREFRPLTVAGVDGDVVSILGDGDDTWVQALGSGGPATVTLSDNRSNTYASLDGAATLTRDDAVIDDLWSPFAAAFFDSGRETPGIAALRVDVAAGRYWSSPSGRIGRLFAAVRAKLGSAEDAGESGSVATSAI